MDDSDFEKLLEAERPSLERYVRFRIGVREDADDVLQEVCLAAYRRFRQLKSRDSFKPWLLSIARNKCADYFRGRAARREIPLEEAPEGDLSDSRYGPPPVPAVRETLERLGDRDRQILVLTYWEELPQAEIAGRLGIPLGTVKSRLYTAKRRFKSSYPYPAGMSKGDCTMTKMPATIPAYTIEPSAEPPFSVKWEELMGWFLVPKLGEKLTWAMYELPSRRCSHVYDMRVTGRARVHGIEGVELTAREAPYSRQEEAIHRTFVAQLTDTHCRYLATFRDDNGVRDYITFLDGDAFLPNWGFGENNCGNETNLSPKGDIRRSGSEVTCADKAFLLDIVGRYTVTINGRSWDTVCVMDVETYDSGVVTEQFLDRNGRTVLWRRYNRDDRPFGRCQEKWSDQLPDNDRLTVNGVTYVHWYDCITEYILS